jgi:hypothetical protein
MTIEREQIEQVFGLTGGELSDESWQGFAHWFEGAPEYATEHKDTDEHTHRTIVGNFIFSSPPESIEDNGIRWEKVATFVSSGETECPGVHGDYNLVENDAHEPCPLCGEKWNEPHGFIYIGEGWAEVVYRAKVSDLYPEEP